MYGWWLSWLKLVFELVFSELVVVESWWLLRVGWLSWLGELVENWLNW